MNTPQVKYTAADLERMSPLERTVAFAECTVTDPSKLPAGVLERSQARMELLRLEQEIAARRRAS